jgi:hypothetical protein
MTVLRQGVVRNDAKTCEKGQLRTGRIRDGVSAGKEATNWREGRRPWEAD